VQFILFFLIVLAILGLGYAYVAWRLIRRSSFPQKWKNAFWVILCFLFCMPMLSFILTVNRVEGFWLTATAWVGYVSLGFFSMVFTLVLARDAVLFLAGLTEKIIGIFDKASPLPQRIDEGRRQFLSESVNLGLIGAAGVLTSYGIYEARRRPAIKEVSIPLKNLPQPLEGYRIVQITDIHTGLTVHKPFVDIIAEEVDGLNPDVIALTGDLADGSVPYLRDDVSPLAQLKARDGKYFVTGNHEYYSGAEAWVEEAERLGYTVLLNSHKVIQREKSRLLLAGVADVTAEQFIKSHASNPHAAVAGAPSCDVRVLLAHQPKSIYAALPLKFDLQISGHTHGGQFFPWNVLAAVGQPYVYGLHKRENTWVYVSKGTGYWGPPVRLGARSEITVIRLTKEPTA